MLMSLRRDLRKLRDPAKAAFLPRFFRTRPGEYGEGDIFIGVSVPQIRSIIGQYRDLPLADIEKLLCDSVHEFRLTGLLLLVGQFERATEKERRHIVRFYLAHLKGVNNWDLVDSSAHQILGEHLMESDTKLLYRLAHSGDLWKQRIAIVATLAFIRRGKLAPTFHIATLLLHHPHDLIHKAVGWMLREAGKRDQPQLERFLEKYAAAMPRTMLRYAIERMNVSNRLYYREKIRTKKLNYKRKTPRGVSRANNIVEK